MSVAKLCYFVQTKKSILLKYLSILLFYDLFQKKYIILPR